MKDSLQALVLAGFSVPIGIVFIDLSRSNITSADNPFLSAQAFFTVGFLFFSFGLGLLATIGTLLKLKGRKDRKPHSHIDLTILA
jgi:hypothetical protein